MGLGSLNDVDGFAFGVGLTFGGFENRPDGGADGVFGGDAGAGFDELDGDEDGCGGGGAGETVDEETRTLGDAGETEGEGEIEGFVVASVVG